MSVIDAKARFTKVKILNAILPERLALLQEKFDRIDAKLRVVFKLPKDAT